MPFDGSGNYTRVHDWTDDRDAGIKILASRMDAEMDDQAAAFNMMFFRNGLVPMAGNLNLGLNTIYNVGSGSLGAPAFKFGSDANTGFFLNGVGKLALVAGGVNRLEAGSAGVAITGTGSVSGNTTIGGTLGVTGATTLNSTLGVTGLAAYSGDMHVAGSVGIANVSPQVKLDVTGMSRSTTGFSVGSGVATFTAYGAGAVPRMGLGSVGNAVTLSAYDAADGIVSIFTNGIERFRVSQTGAVSVNTIGGAPTGPSLNVAGHLGIASGNIVSSNAVLESDYLGVYGGIYTQLGGGIRLHHYATGTTTVASAVRIMRGSAGSTETARFDRDGNFGLGTTAPDGLFHAWAGNAGAVSANASANIGVFENSGSGGISILTPAASIGALYFGSPTSNSRGVVRYDHSVDAMTFFTSGSERVRIDSTGRVGIGTGPAYPLEVSASGSGILSLIRSGSSAGVGIRFANDAGALFLYGTPSGTNTGAVVPGTDNSTTLGSSANRWSVVYAATGTINTSDERTKQDIEIVPDEWLDAWGDVEWARYRFKDAVAAKGDNARWHVGLIAQRVRDVFAERGLDATAIGLLCHDEWGDTFDTDDRNCVIQTRVAGDRWGLRYDECFAMEAAYQRRRVSRIEDRIAALEAAQAL